MDISEGDEVEFLMGNRCHRGRVQSIMKKEDREKVTILMDGEILITSKKELKKNMVF